jgi:hypothetical protein
MQRRCRNGVAQQQGQSKTASRTERHSVMAAHEIRIGMSIVGWKSLPRLLVSASTQATGRASLSPARTCRFRLRGPASHWVIAASLRQQLPPTPWEPLPPCIFRSPSSERERAALRASPFGMALVDTPLRRNQRVFEKSTPATDDLLSDNAIWHSAAADCDAHVSPRCAPFGCPLASRAKSRLGRLAAKASAITEHYRQICVHCGRALTRPRV